MTAPLASFKASSAPINTSWQLTWGKKNCQSSPFVLGKLDKSPAMAGVVMLQGSGTMRSVYTSAVGSLRDSGSALPATTDLCTVNAQPVCSELLQSLCPEPRNDDQ